MVDEGHRLKNFDCMLIRELKQIRTNNKLLLSGTPLQNNLAELWSLLHFILPDVFSNLDQFQSWFDFSAQVRDPSEFSMVIQDVVVAVIMTIITIIRIRTNVVGAQAYLTGGVGGGGGGGTASAMCFDV